MTIPLIVLTDCSYCKHKLMAAETLIMFAIICEVQGFMNH